MSYQSSKSNWAEWHMPVVPTIWEVEVEGPQCKASLGKSRRLYLKNKIKNKNKLNKLKARI
jgi:hypothetical protein